MGCRGAASRQPRSAPCAIPWRRRRASRRTGRRGHLAALRPAPQCRAPPPRPVRWPGLIPARWYHTRPPATGHAREPTLSRHPGGRATAPGAARDDPHAASRPPGPKGETVAARPPRRATPAGGRRHRPAPRAFGGDRGAAQPGRGRRPAEPGDPRHARRRSDTRHPGRNGRDRPGDDRLRLIRAALGRPATGSACTLPGRAASRAAPAGGGTARPGPAALRLGAPRERCAGHRGPGAVGPGGAARAGQADTAGRSRAAS